VSRYLNPTVTIKDYKKYSMHIFGFIAFTVTFLLVLITLMKSIDSEHESWVIYLPYGILIFFLNIFYIKAIFLSREDYEKKLRQEKNYSQTLLQSQKRFLRYVVHETNTPLAIIMANIELYNLDKGEDPLLKNIEAATKNIFGIYDDLSYLTQEGKIEYPKQRIILSDFIKSRIHFFDIVAQQLNVSFILHDNTQNTTILFNETELQRIIDNNITNAIKYTLELENIFIYLSLEDDSVVFEISSHSNVIEDPEHIFDAYYREDTLKDGLGLGLNLVKSICEKEKVIIKLNSSEVSTSFKYYFKKASS